MPKKTKDEADTQEPKQEQGVDAVERALTILEAFADGSTRLTLTEVTQRTGFYRSTILRLAVSLEKFGYLHRDADKQFRLGPSLWRLGANYQSNFDLAEYVRPVLKAVCDAVGETAAFYIRDGDKRICLYRHNASRVVRSHLDEGSETTLERGASARILMAYTGAAGDFYERIRKQGYYVGLGERDPETGGVAVPVFGIGDKLVGSLGVTGPLHRFDEASQVLMKEVLVEQARRLTATLGGHAA
jgi:DNA-binding IclR family transcriptional regulator